jgi:hypothetical protein
MALSVANSQQSSSSSTASLTITSATANNALVAFINQSASTSTPTLTGYTVNATDALYNASANTIWVATKVAAGGETSIAPTAGSGGTIIGLCYWEVTAPGSAWSGQSLALDGSVQALANQTSTSSSLSFTTSVSGDIVLMGVAVPTSNTGSTAWTGSDVATGISTAATRCQGGSYVTTGTLSAQTFTANWSVSKANGMLGIALEPPSAAASGNFFVFF